MLVVNFAILRTRLKSITTCKKHKETVKENTRTTKMKRGTNTRYDKGRMINSSLLLTALFSTTVICEGTDSHHTYGEVHRSRKNELLTHTIQNTRITKLIFFIDFSYTEFTVRHLSEGHAMAQAFHYAKPRSFKGLLNWYLWRTKWRCEGFFSQYFGFPLSVSFHQQSPAPYHSSNWQLR